MDKKGASGPDESSRSAPMGIPKEGSSGYDANGRAADTFKRV